MKCVVCDIEFKRKTPQQQYCSRRCVKIKMIGNDRTSTRISELRKQNRYQPTSSERQNMAIATKRMQGLI